jgi:hypothetical protein
VQLRCLGLLLGELESAGRAVPRETELAAIKLGSWSARHLGDADMELRCWAIGTGAMLEHRRKILEQISRLYDSLDESYGAEPYSA